MKHLAIVALCLFPSLASANTTDIEEIVVKARQVKIVLESLSKTHKQNPITGDWYYVEKKESEKSENKHKA